MSAPVVAYVVAFVLITACILGHLAVSFARQEAAGRHAAPFADPADVTDPDGAQFVHELHHEPRKWEPPLAIDGLDRLLRALRAWPKDTKPDPADTGPIPHAVGTWGKTVTQLLDEMQAKYLDVKR